MSSFIDFYNISATTVLSIKIAEISVSIILVFIIWFVFKKIKNFKNKNNFSYSKISLWVLYLIAFLSLQRIITTIITLYFDGFYEIGVSYRYVKPVQEELYEQLIITQTYEWLAVLAITLFQGNYSSDELLYKICNENF